MATGYTAVAVPLSHEGSFAPEAASREREFELLVFCRDVIRVFELPEAGEATIGRAEESTVRLDDASVSRHHAVLRIGPELSVEDLGSRNGTFVHKVARVDPLRPELATETMSVRQLIRRSARVAVGDSMMFGAARAVVRRRPSQEVPKLSDRGEFGGPTEDPATREVFAQAARAARADISVILLGETGVGKELLARAIHAHSPRAAGPFLAVNCAALGESLLESELFGYEKGAFTGAAQTRRGLFEAANGGTVLLDEVGELPAETQAKLLRVIEERAVRRLGTNTTRGIDVRFIAATNRDLEGAVLQERFRQDLYFRLDGISLTIPPLRARLVDLERFVRTFLAAACRQLEFGQLVVAPEAMERLRTYSWPGNVRELKNVVERAVVLCTGGVIREEHLPRAVLDEARRVSGIPSSLPPGGQTTTRPPPAGVSPSSVPPSNDPKAIERERIIEALRLCAGNQTRAARVLGISRRTLVSRLREHDIPRPHQPGDRSDGAE